MVIGSSDTYETGHHKGRAHYSSENMIVGVRGPDRGECGERGTTI